MARFDDRICIVTGAGSGIGRETARLLVDQGATVIAVDLHGDQEIAQSRSGILPYAADVGDEAAVEAMFAHALERFGRVDVVCANAGVSGGMAGLFDQDAKDWDAVLRVNLVGAFLAVKYGAKAMIERDTRGAIVCTASVAGLRAGAGGPAYSASKAGVINLVQVAAQQLTGSGIRVNAVCPGLVETGMTRSLYENARAKGREGQIGQLNPLQRGGVPADIAHAIAFLTSSEAAYVNGQALVVDGGLSSSHPFPKPRRLGETTF